MLNNLYNIIIIVILIINVITFYLYHYDKERAKKGEWRVKETTLLGLGCIGGAVGALLGMKVFRHKTKHWYFWVINIIGLAYQLFFLFYCIKSVFVDF